MSRAPAIFTVSQLAKLANISRFRMGRELANANVRIYRLGQTRRIYLSDLKAAAPDLWLSIRECQDAGAE